MPRDNPLLKFLKIDSRSGRLTYTRQIPPQLRPYLGGRASIRRTLATESTDCRSTSVLSAYRAVHSEVDRLVTEAKSRAEVNDALIQGQSTAIRATDARLPLFSREIAGIAGQVLLDMKNAAADQRLMSPEYGRCVSALAIKMKTQGISSVSDVDFAVIARPVLDQLQIGPSPVDMTAIGQALMAYVPVMAADMATKYTYSSWFKRVLQGQGNWESRRTGLHSIRGTAIDLQREAGFPVDVRMTITAHTSRDASESVYGDGLQMQPDILFNHLKKVDHTWPP